MISHIKENIIGYLVPLTFTIGWIAFISVMDDRHEAKGTAALVTVETELRAVRREARQVQNYLDQAPSERYGAARESTLRELLDEEKELEEKLERYR